MQNGSRILQRVSAAPRVERALPGVERPRRENQEGRYAMKPIADVAEPAEAVSVRATIQAEFEQVAKEQDKSLPPLSDDLVLADSDFDSLCFAIIVARLEDALGFDPFSVAEDAEFPVTLGDFIRFYETYGDGAR